MPSREAAAATSPPPPPPPPPPLRPPRPPRPSQPSRPSRAQPPPPPTPTTRPPPRASNLPVRRLQHPSPPAAPPVPPKPRFVRFEHGDKGRAEASNTSTPNPPSATVRALACTRTAAATRSASSAGDKKHGPRSLLLLLPPPTPPATPRLPLQPYPRPWTWRKSTATPPTPTSPTASTLTARSSSSACSTRTAATTSATATATATLTTTAATTTTSRRTTQRPPLAARDGNVPLTTMRNLTTASRTPRDAAVAAAAAATTTTTTTTPKMAPDKHKQPPLPTLAKGLTAGRPPLTPKVAGSARAVSTAHHHQTVTVATPLPRRPPARPDSSLGGSVQHREAHTPPASIFLGSSVTPRSGTRQGRVDSTNSTPNGTPSVERSLADAWDDRTRPGVPGGPDSGSDTGFRARPAVSFSPPASDRRQDQQPPPPSSADSKFFYASDARCPLPSSSAASQPKPVQPKGATFFYANGENLPGRPNTASSFPLTPVLAPPAQQPDSRSNASPVKFIYANGTPDMQPSLKPPSGPASVVSSASKMGTARAGGGGGPSPAYVAQRPASPVKLPSHSSTPKSCAASAPPAALNPAGLASAPQLATTTPSANRRISGGALPIRGHTRGNSLTIADPPSVARVLASNTSPEASSLAAAAAAQSTPALTMASILQAAEDFASSDGHHHDGDLVGSPPPEGLASPTRSAFGGGSVANDPLNELVATARRDRKVQDLEIRNASLEAINRTLERQLRKQTAEVRRYRRLSRAGRLSLAPTAPPARPSTRIPSDSTVGSAVEPMSMSELGLSDLSEDEYDSYFDEEDDFSESPSGSESELGRPNPAAAPDRGARHRQRVEQRLQLDLSKHQQLLVDSQKINQSLKRCLGWTEELIREGRRALDYQVRVSEVEIGGRVLPAPDEEEDEDEEDEEGGPPPYYGGDGGGDDTIRIEVNGEPAAVVVVPEGRSSGRSSPLAGKKDPQDRDSGIELRREGG